MFFLNTLFINKSAIRFLHSKQQRQKKKGKINTKYIKHRKATYLFMYSQHNARQSKNINRF